MTQLDASSTTSKPSICKVFTTTCLVILVDRSLVTTIEILSEAAKTVNRGEQSSCLHQKVGVNVDLLCSPQLIL
jgi:hypothetical protein